MIGTPDSQKLKLGRWQRLLLARANEGSFKIAEVIALYPDDWTSQTAIYRSAKLLAGEGLKLITYENGVISKRT
jgi:hypothetical protein